MIVLREYEDFYDTHMNHRTLGQAAPLRPLSDSVADLTHNAGLHRAGIAVGGRVQLEHELSRTSPVRRVGQ
jgi:hypothetical protein